MPVGTSGLQCFYRLQYGINFRRWHGQSYSARDHVRSPTTRNLGTIMEAATDRFAQEFVLKLAERVGYSPAPGNTMEDFLYRDCTGQLTAHDIRVLRFIERGLDAANFPPAFVTYLRGMRVFTQYVTLRYHVFLQECATEAAQRDDLHTLILQAMISGNLRALQGFLDTLRREKRSFAVLFKTPEY